jgi:hypothetical protein
VAHYRAERDASVGPRLDENPGRTAAAEREVLAAAIRPPDLALRVGIVLDVGSALADLAADADVEVPVLGLRGATGGHDEQRTEARRKK